MIFQCLCHLKLIYDNISPNLGIPSPFFSTRSNQEKWKLSNPAIFSFKIFHLFSQFPLEIAICATKTYTLFKSIFKKIDSKTPNEDDANKRVILKIMSVVSAIILTASACSIFLHQQKIRTPPADILHKVMSQLNLKPDLLNRLEVRWKTPIFYKIYQCLHIYLIGLNVALCFTTPSFLSKTSLLSEMCLRSFYLSKLYSIYWIRLTHTLPAGCLNDLVPKRFWQTQEDLKNILLQYPNLERSSPVKWFHYHFTDQQNRQNAILTLYEKIMSIEHNLFHMG